MYFLKLLFFLLLYIFSCRLEWKLNPWLFIDIYIGRKNFYKFYKNNINSIEDLFNSEEKL